MTSKSSFSILLAIALGVVSAPASAPVAISGEPGKTQHLTSADTVPDGLMAADWSGIRAAYQANRYRVVRAGSGYRVRNPKQRWRTEFDSRGFTIQPDGAAWQSGLELKSYGFPGRKRALDQDAETTAEGERVIYDRGAGLREWFINDQRGLEHGFTVEQKPPSVNKEKSCLEFDLVVRGNLRPEISADGTTVRFVDPRGSAIATYSGLKVSDAKGDSVPARFAMQESGLRLLVEERDAAYPITVDPVFQSLYLKASNTEANDAFGTAVAISGDIVVVGAPHEDSSATGVNGDQTDNSAGDAGAAYVFSNSEGSWKQQAYLKASNAEAGDLFGGSVAVSGDTVVVAAMGEDSNATGANGDQSDNSAINSGAVYVFVRNGTGWSQQSYLKASNTEGSGDPALAGDDFGSSVAVSGDTLVVGAVNEASDATGVNGDQDNNNAPDSGAAYVFVRSDTTWSQQSYLKASNSESGDAFGISVSVSDDTVLVGATGEASNATGVDGDQGNNGAPGSGAGYVFVRSGVSWTQQAYLKASNTDSFDNFGTSVGVSGETLVVGACSEDSGATGINGDQADNSVSDSGAAYVFARSGITWNQEAYLKASNTGNADEFGISAAIDGDFLVVGASGEDSGAGIDGDGTDNSVEDAGAAYVFFKGFNNSWSQQSYLKADYADSADEFGISVTISGLTAVIGANGEDSSATGVGGDQTGNGASASGAAYSFEGFEPFIPARPLNVSTRLGVGAGDNVLIGGFIIVGGSPKKILVRGIGPSLADSGLGGVLADPLLELYDAGGLVATNDNWRDSQEQEIIDTGIAPKDDRESAIVVALNPGQYTAILRGVDNTSGIGLVEAYDLDPIVDSHDPQLVNISTRGFIDAGDNVMIGGFFIGPDDAAGTTILVRGIGPSLTDFGVPGALQDPTIELHDGSGNTLMTNDDWKETQQTEIEATGLAPTDERESAILFIPFPGAYTAIVRGALDTTGVGLVEVYNLQ